MIRAVPVCYLTDDEKAAFARAFYAIPGVPDDRETSPTPWGLPWLRDDRLKIFGSSIEDMAHIYYAKYRAEILSISAGEKEPASNKILR